MGLIIGLLTIVLVLTSLLLLLLILIQLPKKESGAGLAFGAGTSDALFGAGSGTVLSRITKYGTGVFLGLCMILAVLYTHQAKASRQNVLSELERKASAAAVSTPPIGATNPLAPVMPAVSAASNATAVPTLMVTNLPAAPALPGTNPPVEPGR